MIAEAERVRRPGNAIVGCEICNKLLFLICKRSEAAPFVYIEDKRKVYRLKPVLLRGGPAGSRRYLECGGKQSPPRKRRGFGMTIAVEFA